MPITWIHVIKVQPLSPGGPLKYNSVYMRDQSFSKTTLNEFLLTDENHPLNEFLEEKGTLNKFFCCCWKNTLYKFLLKNLHTNQVVYWEHSRINHEENIGRKWYPFHMKDKFQKYPIPKKLFFTPLTRHARYAPSCEKSTLFKRFSGHACVHCYIWVVPRGHLAPPYPDLSWTKEKVGITKWSKLMILGRVLPPPLLVSPLGRRTTIFENRNFESKQRQNCLTLSHLFPLNEII